MSSTNKRWAERRFEAVPKGVGNMFQIYAQNAENAEVWDVEGKRYIDFAGGIAVLNTGHRNPKVLARVEDQLKRFSHTCFQVLPYDSYVELAERINQAAPGDGPKKTIFLTTGAEALENAMKIARVATGRQAFISFVGGFHGRTMMTLALTGKVVPYKSGFGPFASDVYHVPFPIDYHGISEEDSLRALDSLFKADVDPKRVAAMFIEPVQGEGGFYMAPASFLRRLREICDEHGILLVADEVQTGFARTGKMFAIEHSGVVPDMIAMAKSLAGGFPLSGVCGRADIMDSVDPGGLGGTFGGSPIACAAGLGVMDAIEEDNLLDRAMELGERLKNRLEAMAKSNAFPFIGDIRGLGAMVAVELVKDRDTREPAPELTAAIVKRASEMGLVLLSCGVRGNVIRFLMPLTASNDVVDEGMSILEAAFGEAAEAA